MLAVAGLLSWAGAVFGAARVTDQESLQVELIVEVEKASISNPIKASVVLKNVSSNVVELLYADMDYLGPIRFKVLSFANNAPAPSRRDPRSSISGSGRVLDLAPGQKKTYQADLQELLDIAPGQYLVVAEVSGRLGLSQTNLYARSVSAPLEVVGTQDSPGSNVTVAPRSPMPGKSAFQADASLSHTAETRNDPTKEDLLRKQETNFRTVEKIGMALAGLLTAIIFWGGWRAARRKQM